MTTLVSGELSPACPMGPSPGSGTGGPAQQAVIVKDDTDTVGVIAWWQLLGAPFLRLFCCYKTIIPDSEEHSLATSGR